MAVLQLLFFCNYLNAKELTIVSTNYPPHIYKEKGKIVGLRIPILTDVFAAMGHTYKPLVVPWKRAIDLVRQGKADGIASIWKKPEREAFLVYPQIPFYYEVIGIYKKKDFGLNYQIGQYDTLEGLKIGAVLGFAWPQDFIRNKNYLLLEEPSDKQNLLKLAKDRLDLVLSDSAVGAYLIKQYDIENIVRHPMNFNQGTWGYVAFSKANPDAGRLAAKFDVAFEEFVRSGQYNRIFRDYLGRDPDALPPLSLRR